MKKTADLIDAWVRDWDHRFGTFKEKEHRKLLFDRSFLNMCRATIYRIEEKHLSNLATPIQRSNKDWIGGFLRLLESAFDRSAPVIADFSLAYPVEMGDLRRELKAGSFDLTAIYPLLQTVSNGMPAEVIGRQISNQLQADENADFDTIGRMSTHLVRSQLGKRNHGELKDMPSKIVSEIGARHFLNGAASDLAVEVGTTKKIWSEYVRSLSEKVGEKNLVDQIVSPVQSETPGMNNFFQRVFRRLQPALSETIHAALERLQESEQSSFPDELERNTAIHETVGVEILAAFIPQFLRALGNAIMASESRDHDSELSVATLPLGDFLLKKFGVGLDRRDSHAERPGYVDLIATEALSLTAAGTIAVAAEKEFGTIIPHAITNSVGRRICCVLARDIRKSDDVDTWTGRAARRQVKNWAARVEVAKNLRVIFSETDEFVLQNLEVVLRSKRVGTALNLKPNRLRFWTKWQNSFNQNARFSGHLHKYFPWHRLNSKEIAPLFDKTFAEMDMTPEKWAVYFTVHGLDSQEKVWESGGITFFDSDAYDFRDIGFFARSKNGNVASIARVDVIAGGSFEASKRAWRRLGPVLDQSAFVLSLNKNYGGFALKIDPYVFAEKIRTQSAVGSRQLDRDERPMRQQTAETIQTTVEPLTKKLTQRIHRGATLSELEKRYLAAIHWYNKGRWQGDPADTYTFYWIAIEALFPSAGQGELFDKIAKISKTWHHAYAEAWYFLRQHRGDVVRLVKEDVAAVAAGNADPKLRGWDTKYTPLLDHKKVEQLIALIPAANTKLNGYIRGYYDYLMGFVDNRAGYEARLELLRDEFRFKLFLLKSLRNDIAHGGEHEHPTFLLYSDELEDVLESLLQTIGNSIINDSRRYKTIEDLMSDLDVWWVR